MVLFFLQLFLLTPLFLVSPAPFADQERTARDYLDERSEVYFSFTYPGEETMLELARYLSIDKVKGHKVFTYANPVSFSMFLEHGIDYTVLLPPGDIDFDPNMVCSGALRSRDLTEGWDFYPTYEAYVDLMYWFEEEYPDLVEVVNIGQTVMGRDLLFAKISPETDRRRSVPQFMYTSTMHGDETTGFILSLRLIHYLVSNYGSDDTITDLMDSVEIWICPNENPDGTYTNNNATVTGATRGNANGVDLNRNYPNPVNDPWQDEQPETTAMIAFTDTMNFIMSANMHGGIELVNFPFDSWTSGQKKHADHDWWEFVMYEYVDTAHAHSPPGYMTGMGDGVTHGGDWYVVYGSRQDYFNYYKSCREFTLELSNQKLLNPALLPAHWEYNHRSLLNYIRQSTYGLHGLVYDNETGEGLDALVYLPGYDDYYSQVPTALPHGNYNRPLLAGTYDVEILSERYDPVTVSNVPVSNHQTTYLHAGLGENITGEMVTVSIEREGEGEVRPFEGTRMFLEGSNLFLVAEPAEGYEFEKWDIGGQHFYGKELIYELQEDTDVRAVFDVSVSLPLFEQYGRLVGVYPNPVMENSEAVIEVDRNVQVSVKLYNMQGQVVATIHNGMLSAGRNTFSLGHHLQDLAGGVYVLSVAGNKIRSHTTIIKP